MIPPKLLDARSLEIIEAKALAAPEGPYVCRDIGPCHQLLAGVTLDPRGRPIAIAAGRPVPVVLETREGRMFLETCRDDALGLLGHIAALELENLELRARLNPPKGNA